MSYTAAVDHLYALGQELAPATPSTPRRKFDLAHMRVLAAALGDPQMTFPSILIAGTNGKGSTAATLASILTAAGYRTGLYTSPHLIRVNERIQIDGHQIPDEDFARLYFQVDEAARHLVEAGDLPYPPSFFEVLTAVGFLYFAGENATHAEKTRVDIAILEVGLGGRLDATNIVEPLLSILTDIALDHQDYLGNTIAEITREKAGILRPNGTLITLPQHPDANQAIGEAAATLNLRAINAASYIPGQTPGVSRSVPGHQVGASGKQAATPLPANHYSITLDGEALEVNSPLSGHHQQRNIALAIAAAAELRHLEGYKLGQIAGESNQIGYKITNAHIEAGIRNTHWPGRLELFTFSDGPQLLLDVAHNPAGAWTLRAAIAQLPEAQPRTLVFSCLRDKDLNEMAQILFPLFDASSTDSKRSKDHIVFAPIDNPRAAHIDDLLAAAHALDIPAHAAPHLAAALAQARAVTPSNGLIIATGSVYLVGEICRLAGEL
ncbi:bifunctional folylpolyglutamate synthase/dihydrofolate synthase [Tunturiibacter gelidoferens]|uniref:Dihydrofolate synthase/folylpolyglutamate synthase n=1 Tax=Tunturiibacter gelidiferens TaxID=3069689 RepID=A0ACC5P1Y7_9BACT|nr:folylpolyglutamate synthase/dihydrofolate synthase family protein [Edaphobacter lichenicola]MBB5340656.1 dihydrofolate synthase/folylpolyglutamate synthase [Edaphobacter lichenicola]